MKKLVLLTLALLCLCLCTSCNDSVSAGSATVTLYPSTTKYLSQQNNHYADFVPEDTGKYYWTYSTMVCSGEVTDVKEYLNQSAWISFAPSSQKALTEKGKERPFDPLSGFQINSQYIFGLKGYSDKEHKNLVWEGYSYGSVTLSDEQTEVPIKLEYSGMGSVFFDIAAENTQDEISSGNGDCFKLTYYKQITGQTPKPQHKDLIAEYNNLTNTYVYKDKVTSPALNLESGLYYFAITQMTWDSNISNYVSVPGRSQILLVNIYPGETNLIAGLLNSGLYLVDQISLFDYTKETWQDGDYTVTKYTPGYDDDITWYINGVYAQNSILVPDCSEWPMSAREVKSYVNINKDDNSLLFYRHKNDKDYYLLSCLWKEDSIEAKSHSITLKP